MRQCNCYYYLSLIFLFFTGASAYFGFHSRRRNEPAFLVPSPEVYDFGTMQQGHLAGEVALTNDSQIPIQILHVMVLCNCGKVAVPRAVIQPGKSVTAQFYVGCTSRLRAVSRHILM